MPDRYCTSLVVVLITAATTSAFSQTIDKMCAKAKNVPPGAIAFVLPPDSEIPISANEFVPTTIVSDSSVTLHVCFKFDTKRDQTRGAVNIKTQISTSNEDKDANKRAVQYENNTEEFQRKLSYFRRTRGVDAYPSLDIQDYQNYHGCTQRRPSALDVDFHIDVNGKRTNDDPYRRKFLFHRDVRPNCDLPNVIVELLESLPTFGVAIATAGGHYDPSVEKIVQRRSAILRYRLPSNPQEKILYMTYKLPRVKKDHCIRIEADDVFDHSLLSSQVIGIACVSKSE